MIIALVIFLITYILLLAFSKYRAFIALGAALLFIAMTYLPVNEWFGGAHIDYLPIEDLFKTIDWNVILMIFGTMGVVSLFIETKMPALLADKIIEKSPNITIAILALSVLSGVISAFVDNVATVLMVAPIALTISKKIHANPVPSLIAISIASNLQGAATLVGDTTSILLGGQADMNFFDFFFYQGKPGLFFIVQIGFIAATFVLYLLLGKQKDKPTIEQAVEVKDYVPTYLMIGTVVLLIIASFFPKDGINAWSNAVLGFDFPINGVICLSLMMFGVLRKAFRNNNENALKETVKDIDFFTLLLLASLFVVIQALGNAGVIAAIGEGIYNISSGNIFLAYTILVFGSVILSAFIDNIPYVATMLPVAAILAQNMGIDPTLLYFGLLIGATLGGNLTPIGASANITAIGMLRKDGYDVKVWDFMRLGIPYTMVAVTIGYVLIWLLYR